MDAADSAQPEGFAVFFWTMAAAWLYA